MRITTMVLGLLLLGSATADAAPLPDGGITQQEMADALRGKKFPAELATDRDGDPLIRSELNGVRFSVYFYECTKQKRCQSIQFYAGWRTQGVALSTINDWNRTKRFGRSYLDRDAEPAVEMDVDLEHGATTQAVANDIDRWVLVLKTFRKYVGEGD